MSALPLHKSPPPSIEGKYWTVQEVAELMKIHPESARRTFQDEPGVIALTRSRLSSRGRARVYLRIPDSVLQRFLRSRTVGVR